MMELDASGVVPLQSDLVSNAVPDKWRQNFVVDDELTVEIVGFRSTLPRRAAYIILSMFSIGVFNLLCRWFPKLDLKVGYSRCLLADAEVMLVQEAGTEPSHGVVAVDKSDKAPRFEYKFVRFHYDEQESAFVRTEFDVFRPYDIIRKELAGGIRDEDYIDLVSMYGPNVIGVPVRPYLQLLLNEVLHPFYIFQVFSMIVWYIDLYWVYATCIFVMAAFASVTNVIQTRRNMESLAQMARHVCHVTVFRSGRELKDVDSSLLVPGDLVEIPSGLKLPCDVILLQGQCVVSESALTGESLPVVKSALPHSEEGSGAFDPERDGKYVLFSGTNVIQATASEAGQRVCGVVYATGFSTAKGQLIRSILFPKATKFKFYTDSFKFIGALTGIALVGFAYSTYVFIKFRADPFAIVLRALDLITIVIPPALPIAMTVGTSSAMHRLKQQNIFCISPIRVNVSGRVDLMCFDKTGTLTEDGLDVKGVRPVTNAGHFERFAEDVTLVSAPLLPVLASCHAFTSIDNQLIGDVLEIKMFQATKWSFHETLKSAEGVTSVVESPSQERIGLVKRFQFSSELQRMSVVAHNYTSRSYFAAVKGSPEMIKTLSLSKTVPDIYDEIVREYTIQGFRVIACAWKPLPADISTEAVLSMPRGAVESDLYFCGLLVMENKLKPTTSPTIRLLNQANIRSVMVTGDNALTGIHVARTCGMVSAEHNVYLCDLDEGGHELTFTPVRAGTPTKRPLPASDSDNAKASLLRNSETDYGSVGATETAHVDLPAAADESPTDGLIASSQDMVDVSLDGSTTVPIVTTHSNRYGKVDSISHTAEPEAPQEWMRERNRIAVTGRAFAHVVHAHPDLLSKVLKQGCVFARMSPLQKAHLIECYQARKFTVGMCGDGANDCGALRAADVGLSLSDAEASVAAPFTSKNPSIESVHVLLREGRCALASSIQIFKYMACYSLIQFMSVVILYTVGTLLGDLQYLWIDMGVILPLVFFMARTKAATVLTKIKPTGSLLSPSVLVSLVSQMAIMIAFQIGIFLYLRREPWYEPLPEPPEGYDPKDADNISCYETTTIFLFSNFQYVIVAVAFSISKPFRAPLYSNFFLLTSIIVILLACAYLTLKPLDFLLDLLELVELEFDFKIVILVAAAINWALVWLYERFVIVWLFQKFQLSRTTRRT